MFKFSYSDVETWTTVRVYKKEPGWPKRTQAKHLPSADMLKNLMENLSALYPSGKEINHLKYKDLVSLFPYIPAVHHKLFLRLKPKKTSENAHDCEEDNKHN